MHDVLHLHCLPGAILLSCMMSYTFIAYLAFWCPVLSEINDVKIFLQTPGLGLDSCATKLGALVLFCEEERENVVEEAKAKDTTFCEEMGVPTETRLRRGRRMAGESAEDAGLSLLTLSEARAAADHRSTPRADKKQDKSHDGCERQIRVSYQYGTPDGLSQ